MIEYNNYVPNVSRETFYKNKLFSILGDSISTLEGYSVPEHAAFYEGVRRLEADVIFPEHTWWGQVIERLCGTLLVNDSFSGSTVMKHPSYMIPSYGCSDKRTEELGRDGLSPDVIMVFMGTNDWGYGTRVEPDKYGNNDKSVFSVAYSSMLEKLKKNYPQAEIWCFTLPISKCERKENFTFPYYYGGRHIEEYCRVIRECAYEYGCKVIDLYGANAPHDTIDGFHPNAKGMKTIADTVLSLMI